MSKPSMKVEVIVFLFAAGIGGFGSHLIAKKKPLPAPSETIATESLVSSRPLTTGDYRTLAGAAEFYEWLGSASAPELEQVLLGLIKEPGEYQAKKWQHIDTLLRKLASIDPARALDLINMHWIDRHGSLREKRRIVIGIWARKDVVAAVDRALAIDPEGEILPLFEPLPTEQAEQLYELLTERGLNRSSYFGNLMSFMASDENVSPALAVDRVLTNTSGLWAGSDYSLGVALERWYNEDSAASMAWLDGLTSPKTKERALSALAETRLQADGLIEIEGLWPQLSPQGKQQLLRNLGRAVQGQDIEQVLNWLDDNVVSPTVYGVAIASLASSGLSSNPEAISRIIERAGAPTPQLTRAVQSAVKSWAGRDPDAAIAFMESVTDTKIRNAAIAGVAQQNIWSDPLEAVRLIGELDFSAGHESVPEMQNIASHLAVSLGRKGMKLDEILELYPESLGGEVAARYAAAFATQTPEKVLSLIEETPLDYNYRYTFRNALETWLAKDPAATMDWLTGLDEGSLRKLAVETVVKAYANEKFETAIQWLESLPPGDSKKAGELELFQFIAANDPGRGLDLAQQLSDSSRRDEFSGQALGAIAARDPDGASRLLGNATLSDEARQNIARHIEELELLRDSLLPEGSQ